MNTSYARSPIAVALALAACLALARPAHAGWTAGTALPDLGTFDLEGALPKLAGQVVLLDFWAAWCGPCQASFPVLEQLHKRYAARGLVVLGVSVDDTAPAMKRFLDAHPVSFATVRDAGHRLVGAADIKAMPSSFLIDRAGRIRAVHTGFRGAQTERRVTEEIEALLKSEGAQR